MGFKVPLATSPPESFSQPFDYIVIISLIHRLTHICLRTFGNRFTLLATNLRTFGVLPFAPMATDLRTSGDDLPW
jgi:hypothetical protein